MTNSIRLATILLLVFLAGCATSGNDDTNGDPEKQLGLQVGGFQPVSPSDTGLHTLGTEINLAEFPNEAVSVAMRQRDAGVTLKYGPASLSAEGGSYEVKVDYIKYRTQQYEGYPDTYRIGLGIRIIAIVKTRESGIDLGSLFAIGFAAENKKLSGTLTMETLGISGPAITPLLPIPSKIDVTTIQNALQAAAAIKSKIYEGDKNVTVFPQVLSVRFAEEAETKAAEVAKAVADK